MGGLAAPAHAGEDLDDGDVDEGSDAVDVAGTIYVVLHGTPPEVLGDERSGYHLSTAVDRTDRESLTVDCSRQARGDKLEDKSIIETIHGVGYMVSPKKTKSS